MEEQLEVLVKILESNMGNRITVELARGIMQTFVEENNNGNDSRADNSDTESSNK